MRIDGKLIAEHILNREKKKVAELARKDITPTMAVIQIGDNPASLSYIHQKQKAADEVGAKINQIDLPTTTCGELVKLIKKLNNDGNIHGIIIQRPLPPGVGKCREALDSVLPEKDIDGFVKDSLYTAPVANAVIRILETVCLADNFHTWLKSKNIVIIGRGETAGAPIAKALQALGCATSIINSATREPELITRDADILISCVGKPGIVTKNMVKPGSILISVGISRDESGKLHGDYEEEEIMNIAPFYTPTPGGVGPVNVACLMENLVAAAFRS